MFAKLFSRITESSLMEEPLEVRYVFMMMLAMCDPTGHVIGTDVAIARRMNITAADFRKCADALMAPDPDSNSKEEDGRRITPSKGERGFFVVNYLTYRDMKTEIHKRDYMREYMRKRREAKALEEGKTPVKRVSRKLALVKHAEEEVDAESEEEIELRSCAEAEEPPCAHATDEEPVLIFGCNGKVKEWALTQSKLDEWQDSFPQTDVLACCRKALQWTRDKQKKTAKGMPAFLGGWIGRAADRGEHPRKHVIEEEIWVPGPRYNMMEALRESKAQEDAEKAALGEPRWM